MTEVSKVERMGVPISYSLKTHLVPSVVKDAVSFERFTPLREPGSQREPEGTVPLHPERKESFHDF